MSNLFIKETCANDSKGHIFGQTEWYETFTDDKGKLFRSLQKEYGKATKMYRDTDKGTRQIGWVFTKECQYDDCKEKYTRSVWVEVSKTEPEKHCTETNVNYPF